MEKGGDKSWQKRGSLVIFRQRYFGTFVSSGFIVMAYAKGCATSFFHPFFQCHWQGNAIQEGREIRRWIFLFSFFFVSYAYVFVINDRFEMRDFLFALREE